MHVTVAAKLLPTIIDNHDSGYLGMAVQLYVQAHLGHFSMINALTYFLSGTIDISHVCMSD